jgi:hypothetical protein
MVKVFTFFVLFFFLFLIENLYFWLNYTIADGCRLETIDKAHGAVCLISCFVGIGFEYCLKGLYKAQ